MLHDSKRIPGTRMAYRLVTFVGEPSVVLLGRGPLFESLLSAGLVSGPDWKVTEVRLKFPSEPGIWIWEGWGPETAENPSAPLSGSWRRPGPTEWTALVHLGRLPQEERRAA